MIYIYIYICEYDVDRCIYIYMLCIPWCILNPFITVVVTPFIPPFHNNHPFHELIAGSEISSVLLVIRGRLGSLANEHPAGPSPPKILKTSTRGCWSIWEVHPVKNHFFRRYDVLFFFGGGGCPNIQQKSATTNFCVPSDLKQNSSCCLQHGWLLRGPRKPETKYVMTCVFPQEAHVWTSGMSINHLKSKPGFWQKKVGQHLKWSTSSGHFSRFVLLQNLRLGHFSG